MLTRLDKQSDTDFGIDFGDVNEDHTRTNQNEGATLGHEKCELLLNEGDHVWQKGAVFRGSCPRCRKFCRHRAESKFPCDAKSTPAPPDPESMPAACEARDGVVESEEAHRECEILCDRLREKIVSLRAELAVGRQAAKTRESVDVWKRRNAKIRGIITHVESLQALHRSQSPSPRRKHAPHLASSPAPAPPAPPVALQVETIAPLSDDEIWMFLEYTFLPA